jgi:hypothetical protein
MVAFSLFFLCISSTIDQLMRPDLSVLTFIEVVHSFATFYFSPLYSISDFTPASPRLVTCLVSLRAILDFHIPLSQ